MAKLSPKQKKIAAKAGDPNKIEGVDFAKIRQEKEAGVGPMQMTTGNTPPGSYAASLIAKGVKAVASHLVNKAKDKVKEDKKPSEMAKKGGEGPKQTKPAPEKENVMQMSDKVGYTMRYGAREKYSPTTFRTEAVMRMSPMLMNHDTKPVDTSNYSADTSAAYSQGSFQGSGGGNFITDRNETTSTSTEVIPGDTTTETKTVTYDDLYNNAIADGKTPEEAQKIVQEARDYNTKKYGTHNPTAEGLADNTITTTTQGDDQIIETTNTEVDESPRTVQTTQKTSREVRKDKNVKNKLNKDLKKTSRKFQKELKGFGMEGLTPGSKEYQAKYDQLNQFDKDKLDNLQRDYDTAKTSKQYFFEGKDQNASFGDQFNTGERETFAQTDFRNQQNQKQRSQNYADMFQQGADRIGASNLADLSSNKSPDSDIINNIFGSPSFMIKPMQFRAQEGSKTSRTGKSKSGGLNRRNNY